MVRWLYISQFSSEISASIPLFPISIASFHAQPKRISIKNNSVKLQIKVKALLFSQLQPVLYFLLFNLMASRNYSAYQGGLSSYGFPISSLCLHNLKPIVRDRFLWRLVFRSSRLRCRSPAGQRLSVQERQRPNFLSNGAVCGYQESAR